MFSFDKLYGMLNEGEPVYLGCKLYNLISKAQDVENVNDDPYSTELLWRGHSVHLAISLRDSTSETEETAIKASRSLAAWLPKMKVYNEFWNGPQGKAIQMVRSQRTGLCARGHELKKAYYEAKIAYENCKASIAALDLTEEALTKACNPPEYPEE